jgi:hypothetical protein
VTDLALLLAAPGLDATAFPPNSRYRGVAVLARQTARGETVKYLAPRIPPAPETMARLGVHLVATGDRLDNLANRYFGDQLLTWRLADANAARLPAALTERPGRRLLVAVPESGT